MTDLRECLNRTCSFNVNGACRSKLIIITSVGTCRPYSSGSRHKKSGEAQKNG